MSEFEKADAVLLGRFYTKLEDAMMAALNAGLHDTYYTLERHLKRVREVLADRAAQARGNPPAAS